MKIQEKNKKLAIALILILAISSSAALLTPNANGLFTTSVPTHAWVAVSSPNPGLGQSIEIVMFMTEISMNANGSGVSSAVNNIGDLYKGYMLTITDPEGKNQTMGPYTADPISNAYILYNPTEIGTYKAQFYFPGQWINDTPRSTTAWPATNVGVINLYYQPSLSNVATFTVQQEPLQSYPSAPLPTEYWTRPLNALNKEWAVYGGDWLLATGNSGGVPSPSSPATNRYQPNGLAPNSGHIVWTKSITSGGTVSGLLGQNTYYTGQSYEVYFTPIIINGILYYSKQTPPAYGYYAVDLRTGQTLWFQNNTSTTAGGQLYTVNGLTLGQTLLYETGNQNGALAYLWNCATGRYAMMDAATGNLISTFNNSIAGSAYAFDAQGDLLAFILSNNRLIMWNSTQAVGPASPSGAGFLEWRPSSTAVYNWANGIMYNVSMPSPTSQSLYHLAYDDGVLVTYNDKLNTTEPLVELTGYDANTGTMLWQKNQTGMFGYMYLYTNGGNIADGVMTLSTWGDQKWTGFDVKTGEKIWTISPRPNSTAWASYDMTCDIDPKLHLLFTTSYDGTISAYNVKTGEYLWTYNGPSSGLETPYGAYPFGGLSGTLEMTVADGKLYATTGEHSPNSPLYRGEYVVALNETTGDVIFREQGWWQFPGFSDGYMVALNGYDNQIYAFGKGRTETTVITAPAINNPSKILISGTVTDQSPGQTSLGIPAAGTPAISDASMSQWMEYLYQQQPKPTNASGVPVSIDATDPNGNQIHLGNTHSDSSGNYAFLADQSMLSAGAGTYTITATFGGSNSYFSSASETTMAYDLPPAATAAPSPQPASVADTYFVPAIAGLFVLIIIVLIVVVLLMVRKRP